VERFNAFDRIAEEIDSQSVVPVGRVNVRDVAPDGKTALLDHFEFPVVAHIRQPFRESFRVDPVAGLDLESVLSETVAGGQFAQQRFERRYDERGFVMAYERVKRPDAVGELVARRKHVGIGMTSISGKNRASGSMALAVSNRVSASASFTRRRK
jgi:hypothetical protein